MSERDTNTKEQHNEPRAWRPWRPPRRQPWRAVLWAVMLVIALVALGWLVVNLYPDIWPEISRKRVATLIGIVVALTVIIVLLALGGASLGWTGFSEKKLWDWLQLLSALALLVVVAAAGFWFTAQQEERQHRIENQRAKEAQKIEGQRAEAERKLAEQRAQDEALQAYLDQMSQLLLERELRASDSDSEVRTLARARTSTVLERLDPSSRTEVMEFLLEAELIQRVDGREPIIALRGANLNGAELPRYPLNDIVLTGVDFSDAYLAAAALSDSDLRFADLSGADLGIADLREAKLSGANLRGADLSGAVLKGAKVTDEQLEQTESIQGATMQGAPMPNGQK